jgi:hypothetical protein
MMLKDASILIAKPSQAVQCSYQSGMAALISSIQTHHIDVFSDHDGLGWYVPRTFDSI